MREMALRVAGQLRSPEGWLGYGLGVAASLGLLGLYDLWSVAHAQASGPAPSPTSSDPLLGVIQTLLGSSPTTAVLVAIASLYGLGPRLAPRLGLGPDPAVAATLARHDERSRITRREILRLRDAQHWQAQVLTALALQAGVKIPPAPKDRDDDSDPDSEPDRPSTK